jgi:hypothetical protein
MTEEGIEAADRLATDRWKSGVMIESLLDPDLVTLLEELRPADAGGGAGMIAAIYAGKVSTA